MLFIGIASIYFILDWIERRKQFDNFFTGKKPEKLFIDESNILTNANLKNCKYWGWVSLKNNLEQNVQKLNSNQKKLEGEKISY